MGKKKKIKALKRELSALKASLVPTKTAPAISPLAPKGGFPDLPVIGGVRYAAGAAGVKYRDRKDVMLAVMQPGTAIAGVFTRSATRSAPVLDCQAKLGGDTEAGAAIIVNSGNSNAFTGDNGRQAVDAVTGAVGALCGLPINRVFSASTGVIGQALPFEKITQKLSELHGALSESSMQDAAAAIMTTDTFPKGAMAQLTLGGKTVSISGIAKGSGMIAPDMATMLVYIFTDAAIDQAILQQMVSHLNESSFNAITVDSDTSTSDSLMVAATGAAGNARITDIDSPDATAFQAALADVMLNLAHQVVRDGEGATKFITVAVSGAHDDADARRVALAIANSPLVKTAAAGEDPNWGRVVMAVGKSGAQADRDRLTIHLGDVLVAEKGWVSPDYTEEAGASYMKGEDIVISVDLGLGTGQFTAWTCDLTHQYITINADYRS